MIYDKIKELADKKGLSVNEVEKKAGIKRGIVCKWNEVTPRADNLYAVAKALGVKVEYFLKE